MICVYGSKAEWARSLYAVVSRGLGNKNSESGYEYLRRILPQLVRSMPGVELEQMGFDEDHAHFIIRHPAKVEVKIASKFSIHAV